MSSISEKHIPTFQLFRKKLTSIMLVRNVSWLFNDSDILLAVFLGFFFSIFYILLKCRFSDMLNIKIVKKKTGKIQIYRTSSKYITISLRNPNIAESLLDQPVKFC